MPDLPVVPEGLGTKLVHKIRRLQLRDKLCKKLILPTLDVVNWAMIVAILVFLVGLLFQLWNTHFQTSGRLLLSCAIIGTALAVLVLGFIVILTLHAVFSDESPFETTFSTWVRSKFRGARLSPNLEPEPQAAAEYLGGLLSNCNDVKSLERAALVFVECFRFLVYNDQKSSLDLDPAIIQILRHDTSPEVKLSVLQGIPQMTRPPNPESNPDSQLGRPSETVLVRLLFRIQEDNSMPFEDLGKAAFRGLIHLSVKANLDDAESSESSVSDYTVRGLRHCAPAGLASDGQMPPAFLGSILAWSSLPDEEQVEVLSRVPLNSLIFSFIVATFWAHRESISGDTRLKRLEKLLYQPIYLDYLEQRFSGRLFDLPKSSGLRFRISKLMRHLKPKSKEDIEPRIHRWLKIYHQSSAKQPRPLGRRSIYQQILDHLGVTIRVVIHEKTDLDFPTLGLLRGLSPLLDEMKICSAAFDGEPRPATQTALALLDILGEIRDSIVREQGRPEGETGDLSMLRWSPLASIVLKSIQRFLDDRTEGDQTVLPQFYHLEVLAYCLNHFNPTLGSRNPKYDGDDDDNDAIFGFLQRCDGFALEDLPALDGSDDDRVRHDFESMKSEVRAALDKFPKKASAQANADKTGTETTQGAPSSPVPAQSSSPEKSGEPKNTSPALDDATSIVVEQADADSSSPTPGTNAGPSETVETERPTRPSMSLILRSQSYIGLERPASPGSVV
ncbi:hypothetical protein SISSUDRAFT_634407 [Sistotremastrum suecicum HHB10207 ss-3]|uniref:Uncharacterized protein n=1 Tax=Sistotremastrum suecicum HHB10207 ss-3 TaxID=1314776 RepID=A0A166EDQ8_9AGAM|nr:hypothetical protein SISSUDRAFT_634407 [Sistotremastrum suecicum HHB10207 ss-3]